jgi:hypothetical protein
LLKTAAPDLLFPSASDPCPGFAEGFFVLFSGVSLSEEKNFYRIS